MSKNLTKKQEAILKYLIEYSENEGYPPSIREIGQEFEIHSLRGVTVHLDALVRKKYIERSSTPRSIKVIHDNYKRTDRVAFLPLIGTIAAGIPIDAEENQEGLIPVPIEMVRQIKNAFLLRVTGDSMTGDGIMPRDLVVIKPQKEANHGDLVAFMVEGQANVKWFHRDKDGIQLISSNKAYDPIPVRSEDSHVIGKVVGLIRYFDGRTF